MLTEVEEPDLLELWRKEPLYMKEALWPHVKFYSKQIEIIESVWFNTETYVHAGNMLGKDFVAGFITLAYFIAHYSLDRTDSQVRVITTSVSDEHLDVLWAEISKFASSARVPILNGLGGPFVMTQHEFRHESEITLSNAINYIKGTVSSPDKKEKLQGHHAKHTLFILDEASGIKDWVYDMGQGWAKKFLIFGNPNPTSNFFYRGCKAGDLKA